MIPIYGWEQSVLTFTPECQKNLFSLQRFLDVNLLRRHMLPTMKALIIFKAFASFDVVKTITMQAVLESKWF